MFAVYVSLFIVCCLWLSVVRCLVLVVVCCVVLPLYVGAGCLLFAVRCVLFVV